MASQITKNQHYIPQFLLNGFGFGEGENRKINVFDVQRNHIRTNQTVKDVFSQNYFYDKDNFIENLLSEQIEAPASAEIALLRNRDVSPFKSNSTFLIKFICCQLYRTVEARQDALDFINAHFSQIVSDLSRLNNLDIENPKNFRIFPKGKDAMRNFTAATALSGVVESKAMEDLKFHLIVNTTDRKFFISDHPVSRYNWHYKDFHDPRIGSLTAKGVQLFLPLSKDVYLCAYDTSVYKYGTRKAAITELTDATDVDFLNELQARNAASFIGFSEDCPEFYVKQMMEKYGNSKIYSRESEFLFEETINDEKIKTTHLVYTTQRKLNRLPSFIKTLKKAKMFRNSFQERDPEVSAALMLLKQQASKRRIENEALTNG